MFRNLDHLLHVRVLAARSQHSDVVYKDVVEVVPG